MGVEIWPYGLINHLKSLLWNEIFTFYNLVFPFSYFGLLCCPVSMIVDWESLWHYCQRQNLFINMRTFGINYYFYSWQPTLCCVKILFLVLYSLCTGVIPYSIVKELWHYYLILDNPCWVIKKVLLPHFNFICPGIIPRSIVHIFEGKTAEEDEDTMYDVRVSYIEIYNEEIRSSIFLSRW